MKQILLICVLALANTACTHKVEVAAKEPITINLNVKIDHEIRVKLDKQLDDVFTSDSGIF
ncbi:MAG: YnbE family lipoprotein [Alteromonadaceae bacterium]|nr:YnbE family lipoprotein [Alteromonadaceae bacterium]